VPATFDDDFDENAGARLSRLAVASLNLVSTWSARRSTSGLVPAWVLARYSDDPGGFRRELVSAGIGERRPKGAVQIVPGGGVTIENACDAERAALAAAEAAGREAEQAAAKAAAAGRRRILFRDPALKGEIRKRDADRCRYCGHAVRWGKGQAADSGTWSLVDPDVEPGLENIVTACKACHSRKGGRALGEAGMMLLGPPAAKPEPARPNPSRNPSLKGSEKGSGSVSRRAAKSSMPADVGIPPVAVPQRNASRSVSGSVPEGSSRARADQDLNQDQGLDDFDFELDPALVSQSSAVDAGARGESDDELAAAVIEAVREREHLDLDRATALRVGEAAVARRRQGPPTDRARYAATVIANEKDLYAKLLRGVAPPLAEIISAPGLPPEAHPFRSDGSIEPTCLTCHTREANYRHQVSRQDVAS